ncbi:MAG TPA: pyridoxamine 5'-phosphate oxidase [Thermomicrobiales bacterium]|nr:pyridoxamine 5'-phosphate oxidase [Thermomicrobiales bacterium]
MRRSNATPVQTEVPRGLMKSRTSSMRREYERAVFDEDTASTDPFEQFRLWFDEAAASPTIEPNAMVVATVSADGQPSQRTVLLKSWDGTGFVFYTNYESRKGRDLEQNRQVSLLFWWADHERQIRVEGRAERTSPGESDAYWQQRPRGSQIGALASPQSQVVRNREWLAHRFAQIEAEHAGGEPVCRPHHWGGIRVVPTMFEFWQGRPNRLHDRLCYRLQRGIWVVERLAP